MNGGTNVQIAPVAIQSQHGTLLLRLIVVIEPITHNTPLNLPFPIKQESFRCVHAILIAVEYGHAVMTGEYGAQFKMQMLHQRYGLGEIAVQFIGALHQSVVQKKGRRKYIRRPKLCLSTSFRNQNSPDHKGTGR